MEGRFGGKLTFATGAGQDIGRAVALPFAREGANGDAAAFATETVAIVDGGQTL